MTHISSADHPDLSFLDGRDIVKILYVNRDFEALQGLEPHLAPMAKTPWGRDHVLVQALSRIHARGVDKGTGLAHLAKMLDIPMSEVIAVGDSANDLAMIKGAGLGVGVANVTDDVRPYCDAILETTGMDGAFGELVERFLTT